MITPLAYTVDADLLAKATALYYTGKNSINKPTGRFFYDAWELKDEYKGTVWEEILATLPVTIGEARIITLKPETSYPVHADIDNRYHLNLQGESCYLIDLENSVMHPVSQDGIWYNMDAGRLHTASNFGRADRVQLVVRQLLTDNKLIDPVNVTISVGGSSEDDSRFIFDQRVSPWMNRANTAKLLTNFRYENSQIKFTVERIAINDLGAIVATTDFKLETE
jgi:hypothetical protein